MRFALLDVRRSLRAKLVAGIAALLLVNSIFLLAFLPRRMEEFSRRWVERRAIGMAVVVERAAAPRLEHDEAGSVQDLLDGMERAPEVLYAAVRRADGSVLGALHRELLPAGPARVLSEPLVVFGGDRVTVDAPVVGRGGARGTLSIGFSLGDLDRDRRANLLSVGALSVVLFAIGLGFAFTIGTAFARPIRAMTDLANRIAAGDLSHSELSADRADEVGQMAGAFARMVGEQRRVVQQIAATATQLGRAAAQIYAAAQEQEAAAAKESSGIREVGTTVQSLLDSAANIARSARGVLQNAERTKETNETSARRIAELSTHTVRIAELLEVIRDIADRSDLLALNASLEATRAGESGRGFTLVAAEMRRLAERVTASVEDVKSLLADVRASGSSSVQATEEGRRLAESTTESARQITQVTQTQRTATEVVSGSMAELEEVLSALLVSSHMTRSAAGQLKLESEQLEQMIGRFRFDGTAA